MDDTDRYRLTDVQAMEVARMRRSLRDGSGKLATDEEMAALWTSCGRPPDAPVKPE